VPSGGPIGAGIGCVGPSPMSSAGGRWPDVVVGETLVRRTDSGQGHRTYELAPSDEWHGEDRGFTGPPVGRQFLGAYRLTLRLVLGREIHVRRPARSQTS
jgi:hypothetical protein